MRLRRIAGDHEIDDRNNGHRHEIAFVKNIERNGILMEADLLPDSYGGKFHPRAVPELLDSLPVILRSVMRGKVTPRKALIPHRLKDVKQIKRIFETVEGNEERFELNLYIVGKDEDEDGDRRSSDVDPGTAQGTPASSPPERSPNA
jgi:succinate dehydrogenase / fumarate reductase iron-sulfur subunit